MNNLSYENNQKTALSSLLSHNNNINISYLNNNNNKLNILQKNR